MCDQSLSPPHLNVLVKSASSSYIFFISSTTSSRSYVTRPSLAAMRALYSDCSTCTRGEEGRGGMREEEEVRLCSHACVVLGL